MTGSFWSVQWNTCVHRLDHGLYSHLKELGFFFFFLVRTHVISKGKIPSAGDSEEDGTCVQDSKPNTLPTEVFWPPVVIILIYDKITNLSC